MVNSENLLITNEYVRETLDEMVNIGKAKSVNPLVFMYIVDLHMLASDFTFVQNPRAYALHDLLVSLISDQYMHQRGLHQLGLFTTGISLASATKIIHEDSTVANPDLIGWSWLYFHYVEINLHISQQQYCQIVNLEDRTIRRYQNRAIGQLTNRLIQMEKSARARRQRQILYFKLPHKGNIPPLVERDEIIDEVKNSKLNHYNIWGASGIGKTVFVEHILKTKIDSDELDNIVWIELPETINIVKSYLHDKLLTVDSKISLVEYVSLKQTAIVLDGAEVLQANLSDLQNFMQEFSNASIYIISQRFAPMPDCLHIPLQELSLTAAERMLETDQISIGKELPISDYTRLIWQSVGGNPLAMKLLAQNWSVFEIQSATYLTLDNLFSRLFETISASVQLAWLLLALLKDNLLDIADLSGIQSSYVKYGDFITLGYLSITETSHFDKPRLSITVSAYKYIKIVYESKLELQHLLNKFVAEINTSICNDLELILVEAILSTDWILLRESHFAKALHNCWLEGLRQSHFVKWYSILRRHVSEPNPTNIDLAIGYGVIQRCLGNWREAYSVFNALVQYTGMHGMFAHQSQILLELAILLRFQGNYAAAINSLDRIEKSSFAIPVQVRNRLLIERIEIALEANQFNNAKLFYESLPKESPYRIILQLEIYLKESDNRELPFSENLTENLLGEYSRNPSILARIHILIGRIYEKNDDIELAIKHLSIALSILTDEDNDPFALARAQSNLAMLLTTSSQLKEAQTLLKSANHIQRTIGDRVGLAVTMHNEHALIRKIVN